MWTRRKITPKENSQNISFNDELGLKHAILREPSVVDEFYFEKCEPCDDNKESYSVCDPIIILFNQERLNNMGPTAVKTFLDSLVPRSNPLAELRKKCSDEDLMSMMKSRHLQSPAEILAWCRYMNDNVKLFNSEVAKLVAEQEAANQEAAKQEAAKQEAAAVTSSTEVKTD